MTQTFNEIGLEKVALLRALDELGDGVNAWYVERPALTDRLGITDQKLNRALRELEQLDLVEPTFSRPLRWRVRRKGQAFLRAWDQCALVWQQQVAMADWMFQETIIRYVQAGCDESLFQPIQNATAEWGLQRSYLEQGASLTLVRDAVRANAAVRDEVLTRVRGSSCS